MPLTYPLRPPSFRFLTPTGRFEVNREICLSISGHHEETWQPAWGIRTALVAIRSFMDTDVKGQVGGLMTQDSVRRDMAKKSGSFVCSACKKSNKAIVEERKEAIRAMGEDATKDRKEETIPEELRLAYREELRASDEDVPKAIANSAAAPEMPAGTQQIPGVATSPSVPNAPQPSAPGALQQRLRQPTRRRNPDDAWIDSLMYIVGAIMSILILKKILLWLFP